MLRRLQNQKKRASGKVSGQSTTKKRKNEGDDADDAEIRRLEAMLGLKGSGKSRNSKLARDLARMGLPSGLDKLLDDIDNMEKRIDDGSEVPASVAAAAVESSDDEAPELVKRTVSESEAESTDNEVHNEESEGSPMYSEDDQAESEGVESENEDEGELDGGEAVEEALPSPSPGAWVPPSRRGLLKGILSGSAPSAPKPAMVAPEKPKQNLYGKDLPSVDPSAKLTLLQLNDSNPEYIKIKRRVQGVVNRLSEANLDPLSAEIVTLYDTNGKAFVNNAVTDALLTMAGTDTQVLRPLVMVYAALVSALHIRVDPSVSGFVLERIIRRFLALAHVDPIRKDAAEVAEGLADIESPDSKLANNLLLFLCYLCMFNTVHANMMFDVLDLLAQRLSEWDVELLLLALQHCGFHLRSEDPDRLKSLLSAIESKSASGKAKGNMRLDVMLELIQDVRNKRVKQSHQQIIDRGAALRKWINRLASRHDQSGIDRRFRASLADVCNIERTGRWWLVGASWVGRKATEPGQNDSEALDDDDGGDEHIKDSVVEPSADAALLELARKQRMNTAVKRNVFVALMGADDPESAMDRLLKLGLKGPAEREIVRVLVDCSGQETSYNPFYADVAVKLCNFHNRFKFTFQLTLWDEFKTIEDHPSRRVYNLSRLTARLFLKHCLSLSVLKVLDFTSLKKHAQLFLRSAFTDVLCCQDEENVRGVFSRAGAGPDKVLVRDGMMIFLQKYMRTPAKTVTDDSLLAYRRNFKVAKQALQAIVKDEVFDF